MTEARRKKLQTILDRLNGGKIVQNRQLQTVLGDEGYARYLADCRMQQDLRDTLQDKPDTVKEYEERLKKAMFAHIKGNAASGRGQSYGGTQLIHNAQHQFERALEHLSEALAQDPGLEMWFDRHPDSETAGSRLSPQNMPQVVTSRSAKNRGGGHQSMQRSIRQVKIDAVERELDLLNGDGPAAVSQDEIAAVVARTNRLKKLMGKWD